ncbi:MAG: hypothetical protein U0521_06550 [Anaerolineae bacterium]
MFVRRAMSEVKPPLRWGFVHRDLHLGRVLSTTERIGAARLRRVGAGSARAGTRRHPALGA